MSSGPQTVRHRTPAANVGGATSASGIIRLGALALRDTPTARYLHEELERSVYSDENVIDLTDSEPGEEPDEDEVEEPEAEEVGT